MSPDVVVVGGGLGGSVTAKKLAEQGRSVVVLEHETTFKDRVRGEQMHPWGGAAAKRLGIYEELMATCAHGARFFDIYGGGERNTHRDLRDTTPSRLGSTNFYHPKMQEVLLAGAARAGAEVIRGATVESIVPGRPATVTFTHVGKECTLSARLVVAADGRKSKARGWGGFEVKRDPDMLTIAGALFEKTSAPDDALHLCIGPEGMMMLCPLGGARARAYFIYPGATAPRKLSGNAQIPELVRLCRSTGAPAAWFEGIEVKGPLAEFECADQWVPHPYKDGVALVGDAAGAADPSFGCGLSCTLRDVEALVTALGSAGAPETWDAALDAYASKHDEHYGVVHSVESWMRTLLWTPGPEGDARRAKVMPVMREGNPNMPDIVGLGPESPHDETARKLMLGEA